MSDTSSRATGLQIVQLVRLGVAIFPGMVRDRHNHVADSHFPSRELTFVALSPDGDDALDMGDDLPHLCAAKRGARRLRSVP
jgi:hypothetical protein